MPWNYRTAFEEFPQCRRDFVHAARPAQTPMLYPKPNGGHRILPSLYAGLTDVWLRANQQAMRVCDMNNGHLKATMKLLQESNYNAVDRSTSLLGKMAGHYRNQPDIVEKLRQLCLMMQKVDVDDMYPIFKPLADELALRETVAANLIDDTINWDDL